MSPEATSSLVAVGMELLYLSRMGWWPWSKKEASIHPLATANNARRAAAAQTNMTRKLRNSFNSPIRKNSNTAKLRRSLSRRNLTNPLNTKKMYTNVINYNSSDRNVIINTNSDVINHLLSIKYPLWSNTIQYKSGEPVFDQNAKWLQTSDDAIKLYDEMAVSYKGGKRSRTRRN